MSYHEVAETQTPPRGSGEGGRSSWDFSPGRASQGPGRAADAPMTIRCWWRRRGWAPGEAGRRWGVFRVFGGQEGYRGWSREGRVSVLNGVFAIWRAAGIQRGFRAGPRRRIFPHLFRRARLHEFLARATLQLPIRPAPQRTESQRWRTASVPSPRSSCLEKDGPSPPPRRRPNGESAPVWTTLEKMRRSFTAAAPRLPFRQPAPPAVEPQDGAAGKPIAIISKIRCMADQADAEPTFKSAKSPKAISRTALSTRPYIPPPAGKRENLQHAPPAHWALPRHHHSPADTRRAAGPRRRALRRGRNSADDYRRALQNRRRCLCFQLLLLSQISERPARGTFVRALFTRFGNRLCAWVLFTGGRSSSYWSRARFRNCSASSAGTSRPTSPMPAVGTPMNTPASSKAAPPLLPSLMSASVLM